MLYLTRKVGESIVINDDIELTVVEVRGKSIKLGMTFPEDVSVYRREVYDRIQAEKQGGGISSGSNSGGGNSGGGNSGSGISSGDAADGMARAAAPASPPGTGDDSD